MMVLHLVPRKSRQGLIEQRLGKFSEVEQFVFDKNELKQKDKNG
jgi:hypothetical protein